ncbi:hypothetical protein EVAR_72753_1 [Eumeta japonica]|uniref:Uncharacterized protein n=1 Tax=Eumeta variegata TaxID=151549 RepID=A0A4C1TR53_EUMVA|nr:hypothetical protein EVAR_72753_1 [Eumeta japonica]
MLNHRSLPEVRIGTKVLRADSFSINTPPTVEVFHRQYVSSGLRMSFEYCSLPTVCSVRLPRGWKSVMMGHCCGENVPSVRCQNNGAHLLTTSVEVVRTRKWRNVSHLPGIIIGLIGVYFSTTSVEYQNEEEWSRLFCTSLEESLV